ncbi:hypothetical protein Daqu01_03431 [Deinococcus aquaticus]
MFWDEKTLVAVSLSDILFLLWIKKVQNFDPDGFPFMVGVRAGHRVQRVIVRYGVVDGHRGFTNLQHTDVPRLRKLFDQRAVKGAQALP